MRVRHKTKDSEPDWYVLEETESFYVVCSPVPGAKAFALEKRDYKPIHSDPTYRDVTGECEMFKNILCCNGDPVFSGFDPTYRLRKLQLLKPGGVYGETTTAFIVEKRDQE